MSKRQLATNPIRWIANQIDGVSFNQLGKYFKNMIGMEADSPHRLAQAINKRDQVPEVIRMPLGYREPNAWAMFHFPQQGRHRALTFATEGKVNPQPITLAEGNTMWEFRNRSNKWMALTAGINTKTGRLCYDGACAPRAISGATGLVHRTQDIIDDMQEAFQDLNGRYPTFRNGFGPNRDELHDYISSEYGHAQNGINLEEFTSLSLPPGATGLVEGVRTNKKDIAKVYSELNRHPRSIVFLNTLSEGGHAISYYNGLQQRYHPLEVYAPWNTNRITEVFVPKHPNKPVEQRVEERGKLLW